MFDTISSFQNPRVKLIKKLRDKKHRERESRFIIDYDRDLKRALENGYKVDFMFYCPEIDESTFDLDVEPTKVFQVSREMMENVSYRQSPSSVVAVMHPRVSSRGSVENVEWDKPVLVLVDLKKPGNIGALLRTADAVGLSSVILVDSTLDIYNPNIIRASTGAVFALEISLMNSEETIRFLQQNQYSIFSTHLSGDQSLFEVQFPHKSAIVLGTEDIGLDDYWVNACDALIKIPMVGQVVDSLNVSVTGAICMYEMFRQHIK